MTLDTRCPGCTGETILMKAVDAYACFACMRLHYPAQVGEWKKLISLYDIKRKKANDWKIGSHKQLQKNQLWEEELEELYAIWLTKKVTE